MSRPDWADRKKSTGRPPLPGGRETLNLTLPPHAKRWLLARPLGASGQVLAWVEAQIARDEASVKSNK